MTYAMFPHCNTEVLHAPSTCQFCDKYPDRQAARAASGGGFTPPEANGWEGNRAQPVRVAAAKAAVTASRNTGRPVHPDVAALAGEPPPSPIEILHDGPCQVPQPRGWRCRRGEHEHGTPCASVPRWWNLRWQAKYHGMMR